VLQRHSLSLIRWDWKSQDSYLRFGLYENQLVGGTTWRPSAILGTASKEGMYGAFLWNVYETNAQRAMAWAPVDTANGNPLRPKNNQCRGLWFLRPDGTTSSVLSVEAVLGNCHVFVGTGWRD